MFYTMTITIERAFANVVLIFGCEVNSHPENKGIGLGQCE